MASSSRSTERMVPQCAAIVKARTEECLEEMRNMSPDERANGVILIGRTGVGKSALLEYLTNAQGHSKNSPNPVTLEFQLERVEILGKRYYIMDTPGFDTDKEQTVFREIVRGIQAICPYTKIVSVMLVTRINDNRAEAVDSKLVTFTAKLCGPEYAAQIMVVTNFWNVSELEEKVEFEARLAERLQRWRGVLGQEVKQYQHGRRYNPSGEDVGDCLKWRGDSEEIKKHAKAMIDSHCRGNNPREPRIIQELSEGQSLGRTAAGVFLRGNPSTQYSSPSSTFEFPPEQRETRASPSTSGPSTSFHGAARDQRFVQASQSQQGTSPAAEAVAWACRNIAWPLAKQAWNNLEFSTDKGVEFSTDKGVEFSVTSEGAGFPRHLDPLSSRDHFLARGLNGDLGSRTEWAKRHGITLEPGSADFGDTVRNTIERVWPL